MSRDLGEVADLYGLAYPTTPPSLQGKTPGRKSQKEEDWYNCNTDNLQETLTT